MTAGFPAQHARTRRFTLGRPRGLVVGADHAVFLRSPSGDDPTHDLWRLDLATGEEHPLLRAADLDVVDDPPPAERARRERVREQGGGLVSVATDRDVTRAVVTLGGAVFVVDVATGEVTVQPQAEGVLDPRLSPDGSRLAFVRGDDLLWADLGRTARPLATEADVAWGRAEFVAAEELQRTRGFWWAPDSRAVAACRVDERDVPRWWIADPSRPALAPRDVRYPAAGTVNADVRLAILGIDEPRRIDVRWDREALPYLAQVRWDPRAPLTLLVLDRTQHQAQVLRVDDRTGACEIVRSHHDAAWLDVVEGTPRWTPDGRLVEVLDLPGHGAGGTRALVVDEQVVTPAGLQVRALLGVDDTHAWLAASADPTRQELVRVVLDGGEVTSLAAGPAVHAGTFTRGRLVHVAASVDGPVTTTVDTDAGPVELASHAQRPQVTPRPTWLELGARALRAVLLLPERVDGPLPVLLDPYGGPHAQRVRRSRDGLLVPQWFADQGFAVLVVDGRGSPGRGPAFEREVARDLATPALADQLDALDDALRRDLPLDGDRVAIRGWSFGGFLAALAALRRPDRIRAAIAGAPVTDWSLYDTAYTERYLGHPDRAPDAYRVSSLVDAELELLGAVEPDGAAPGLLLIHGLADDNVVAAHTLRLSAALLAAGRPHELLALSGVTHMTPQEVVAEQLLLRQLAFLRRHLGGDEPPTTRDGSGAAT